MIRVDRTFHLMLSTLLTQLRTYEVVIYADVPMRNQICRAYLFVKQRMVIASTIEHQGHLLMQGEQAYAHLQTHKEWRVSFESPIEEVVRKHMARFEALPFLHEDIRQADLKERTSGELPEVSPNTQPLSLSPTIPKPKATLDMNALTSLSSKQRFVLRSVLTMINGSRSVEQIKSMLHLPSAVVDECLEYLRSIEVIE